MILIIDNYDSFVHNLARYIRECGRETAVVRNDEAARIAALIKEASGIVISPGPKTPKAAGVCLAAIAAAPAATPLLGVCLGHQCLVEAFGGRTARARLPLHGEARAVRHNGRGIFAGVASPAPVGRYHSLISILPETGPLVATAWSEEDELMGVCHRDRAWFGVQFHPESLLTPDGRRMVSNFVDLCADRR